MIFVNRNRYLAVANSQGQGWAIENPQGRALFDTGRWPDVRYAGSSHGTWLAIARAEGLPIAQSITATDAPIDLEPGEIAPATAKPWTLQPGQSTCGRTWRRA
jgi:hypothetical protein